ncbi:protein SHQ1 homolog isoform X2 [Brienomyrus brachyistius]|uniref:protein SHQ1 homolog isoform X2 n=1 Tax=Brienomyrus brachyistius TaxID=42636 RepID=UPI0020B23F52|nr:protein SHQ1 homolog isoform X2 [Brienomyrus brachyistius]
MTEEAAGALPCGCVNRLFTLRVPKESPGEHFEGLDMLTSLLAPKGSRSAKPLVEEMDTCEGAAGGEEEEDEDFDWQMEQEVYVESSEEELGSLQKYGFGNQRSGVFTRLQEELGDIVDVKNPDASTATERRENRLAAEDTFFCPDHYLVDLFENEEIGKLVKFCPWWSKCGQGGAQAEHSQAGIFTDEEQDQLRRFTNRSYLLDKKTLQHVWLGLVDIILAYAYDTRITEGEHCVESAWNIRKVSGTLCWLETYSTLQEVLVSFGRRCLCYPLFRHFDLITTVIHDAASIFQSGKAYVLKCLLDVHKIFRENDPAYILNDLYITDYCVWIQKVKSKKVVALAEPLLKASLTKEDMELELDLLEKVAMEGESQEEEGDDGEEDDETEEEEEDEKEGLGIEGSSSRSHVEGQLSSDSTSLSPKSNHLCLKEEGPVAPSQKLIQELVETVEVGLRVSEPGDCEGSAADDVGTPQRTLLEVGPRKNPLLIVSTALEDDSIG